MQTYDRIVSQAIATGDAFKSADQTVRCSYCGLIVPSDCACAWNKRAALDAADDRALHLRVNRYLPAFAWSLPLREKVMAVAFQVVLTGAEDNKRTEVLDLLAQVGRVELR